MIADHCVQDKDGHLEARLLSGLPVNPPGPLTSLPQEHRRAALVVLVVFILTVVLLFVRRRARPPGSPPAGVPAGVAFPRAAA